MPGPRPNNQAAIAGHVRGLAEAKAAFQRLPEIVRERLNAATEISVQQIVRGAQARLQQSPSIQTRALHDHVRWAMNRGAGRGSAGVATGQTVFSDLATRKRIKVKGIIVARKAGGASGHVDKPSRRAHFIEFGTRHHPAEPFMLPAAEAEQQPYLQRCIAAGKGIERDVAAIGMRNL